MNYIFFNNTFLPEDEKVISINDRSFRLGDGVFETISVYGGKLYQQNFHTERLRKSLAALRIKGVDSELAVKNAEALVKKNNLQVGFVRIAVSRGEGGDGYLPPENPVPQVAISTKHRSGNIPDAASLWLSQYKKVPAECMPVGAKTANGLNSVLARIEARENDCFEALLLDLDRNICEGSSANIFWFKGDTLYTPSEDTGLLAGAIREAVIRTAPFQIKQGKFMLQDIMVADEVFMTNVSWVIMPVTSLMPVGSSYVSGAKTGQIAKAINDDIREQCKV